MFKKGTLMGSFFLRFKELIHVTSTVNSARHPHGTQDFFLWLLHSCPDQFRRFPLRKTQTSSPLIKGSYISSLKRKTIFDVTILLSSCQTPIFSCFVLSLNSLKKADNILLHCSSNTPFVIST